MAFLGRTYSREELPEQTNDPVPAGDYTARIIASDVKETKSGTGRYITATFQITGPSHEGRQVFTNINIENPNDDAMRIGLAQLNELLAALNLQHLRDTDELIGGTCLIKVKIKVDPTGQYEPRNEISRYRSLGSPAANAAPAGFPKSAPPSAPPAQTKPAAANPPWRK